MSIVSLWPKTKRLLRRVYGGPWYKKLLVWLCTLFLLLVLGLVAVDCNFLYLFGRSPGFSDTSHFLSTFVHISELSF